MARSLPREAVSVRWGCPPPCQPAILSLTLVCMVLSSALPPHRCLSPLRVSPTLADSSRAAGWLALPLLGLVRRGERQREIEIKEEIEGAVGYFRSAAAANSFSFD